jgi:acetylornithine/succinyldiaminopimelate/putrescine aminotransferase
MTQRELFFNHISQTSAFPLGLEIQKAEGVYLYDTSGKKYLDFISGIAVSNVGHRHPKVLEAIKKQLDKYLHLMVYGEFIQSPQNDLAAALVCSFGKYSDQLNNVYFTNSGTEAIEGAMKLAKRYTQRTEIIACFDAYHGASQGALSLSGSENFTRHYRPLLPDIKHIQFGNIEDIQKITSKTAAIVIEVISAESGIKIADRSFFEALKLRCKATGTLLVFDEIQTGFGRTGKFWAFEHYDIAPDIITCAKGMGGGLPIGAFISSQKIMSVFQDNPILGHITTFGGNPVCCAASLATLKVIFGERLLEEVENKGNFIKSRLQHKYIKEVRGIGLMLAVEFESFEVLKPIIDECINQGLITDWFLFCDNSMRIAPPLTITYAELEIATTTILEVLNSL